MEPLNLSNLKELITFKKVDYDRWGMYYLLSSLGYKTIFEHSLILDGFVNEFIHIIKKISTTVECNQRMSTLLSFKDFGITDVEPIKLKVDGTPTNYTRTLLEQPPTGKIKSRSDNIKNCSRYRYITRTNKFCGTDIEGDIVVNGKINYEVAGLADVYNYPGVFNFNPVGIKHPRNITTSTIEEPDVPDPKDKEELDYLKISRGNDIFKLSTRSDRSDELQSVPLLDQEDSVITEGKWYIKGIINKDHKIVIGKVFEDRSPRFPLRLEELNRYLDTSSIFTPNFYKCIHPIPSDFFSGLASATHVRLLTTCHGCIEKPFTLSHSIQLRRLSVVVPGVCAYVSERNQSDLISKFTNNDKDYISDISSKFFEMTQHICKHNLYNISEYHPERINREDALNSCRRLKSAPNKMFSTLNNEMFNKSFVNQGGFGFVLIGYHNGTEFTYINLFSIHERIDLKDILTYIPSCTNLFFADASCSKPCGDYKPSTLDLSTYGGTRRTRRRRRKTRKSI
jgi:hypothetical protein